MKLCDAQLQDINPADILGNGFFRRCNTYKGGGGYDKFPEIYQRRFGEKDGLNDQFVVQLRGCVLDCPYCYVTREGVSTGDREFFTTEQLVEAFKESGCGVFHLMGGAPAIYLNYWERIIELLPEGVPFHSDLLLLEDVYDRRTVNKLATYTNTLYAVSIKGSNPCEFERNTNTEFKSGKFWYNLESIVQAGLQFYFTFTGMSEDSVNVFKDCVYQRFPANADKMLEDAFSIDLIHYKALDYKAS